MAWVSISYHTNHIVALKQFPKINGEINPAAIREVYIMEHLLPEGLYDPDL